VAGLARGRGLGRLLLEALIVESEAQGIWMIQGDPRARGRHGEARAYLRRTGGSGVRHERPRRDQVADRRGTALDNLPRRTYIWAKVTFVPGKES
jgi:hypothetical protein